MRRFSLPGFQFDEVRIATIVFVLMLVPVAAVMALMEVFVPGAQIRRIVATAYEITPAPQLRLYVLYLTSGVAHLIVSTLVVVFLKKGLDRNVSPTKRAAISRGVYALTAVIIGLFFVAVYLGPVLARLSHERLYAVLTQSPLFAPYFVKIPGGMGWSGFYVFSLLPFALIAAGLVVIVLGCFSVGKDVAYVTSRLKERPAADMRRDVDLRIRSFHNYFYVLSSVLATSTIATALFLKLPLTSVSAGEGRNAFDELSTAMALCWGVTFSLTMLAMCFYPYFRVQRDLRTLLVQSRVTDDAELQKWVADIQENYVVYTNLKSLLSIFVPAVVGALSRFV